MVIKNIPNAVVYLAKYAAHLIFFSSCFSICYRFLNIWFLEHCIVTYDLTVRNESVVIAERNVRLYLETILQLHAEEFTWTKNNAI